ncbi:MAG: hypothetical protein QOJ64_2553 [Acidobacteriota bacterium]|jgi:hypothetical protein|nr:hypothetical protein [Acidobacteriota bacterium]
MWSDNETVDDLIGFRVHVDLIREVVMDKRLLPVTLGVFGDWGNGKTSIMRMLERELDPDSHETSEEKAKCEPIAVLYFNGWLFEGYDDAKSALLSSILKQLSEHKRFGPRVREKVSKLFKRVDWMRVSKAGLSAIALPAIAAYASAHPEFAPQSIPLIGRLLSWGTKKEPNAGDEKKPFLKDASDEDELSDIRTFRDEFGKLLKDSDIQTLVVLIDDLDRCSPERLIENLEAIKLFLNVENTAFVIGADPRIVRHAIAVRYRDSISATQGAEEDRLITDYLEKLIQVPYHLPRLSPSEVETYMALLFCMRDLPAAGFSKCVGSCNRQRATNRFRSFGFADVQAALAPEQVPAKLGEALAFCATASSLISEGLKGNPRQVKRFLNAYFLRRKLASVAQMETIRDDVLLKLMILEYADEDRFRELAVWQQNEDGHPRAIAQMERLNDGDSQRDGDGKYVAPDGWATTRLKRWIQLDPKLADVDLRDYFWLARDRLASTVSGMGMVPPRVRTALEGLLSKATRRVTATGIVKELEADELAELHKQLTLHIKRLPGERNVHDAFVALFEQRRESARAYGDSLLAIPVAALPAFVPDQLVFHIRQTGELAEVFQPVLDYVKQAPDTKAGKAALGGTRSAPRRTR